MRILSLILFLATATACGCLPGSPVPDTDFRFSAEALDEGFAVKLENTSAENICIYEGAWPVAVTGGILPGVTGGNYVGHTSSLPYVEIGEQKYLYGRWLSHLGHSSEQLKIKSSEIIETTLPYADFDDLPENLMDAELRYPITPTNCR